MKIILLIFLLFACSFAKANYGDTTLPIKRYVLINDPNKQPTYIVNGKLIEDSIAGNFLARLDPKLISHIEVLKDDLLNSICNCRKNNAVIIITTKQTNFIPYQFYKPPEYKYDNYTL